MPLLSALLGDLDARGEPKISVGTVCSAELPNKSVFPLLTGLPKMSVNDDDDDDDDDVAVAVAVAVGAPNKSVVVDGVVAFGAI